MAFTKPHSPMGESHSRSPTCESGLVEQRGLSALCLQVRLPPIVTLPFLSPFICRSHEAKPRQCISEKSMPIALFFPLPARLVPKPYVVCSSCRFHTPRKSHLSAHNSMVPRLFARAITSSTSQLLNAVSEDDIAAGIAILAATPAKEAVRVLPSEGTSAIHVAARAGSAFWAQLLVWVGAIQLVISVTTLVVCHSTLTPCWNAAAHVTAFRSIRFSTLNLVRSLLS